MFMTGAQNVHRYDADLKANTAVKEEPWYKNCRKPESIWHYQPRLRHIILQMYLSFTYTLPTRDLKIAVIKTNFIIWFASTAFSYSASEHCIMLTESKLQYQSSKYAQYFRKNTTFFWTNTYSTAHPRCYLLVNSCCCSWLAGRSNSKKLLRRST